MPKEKDESTKLRERVTTLEQEIQNLKEIQEKKKWTHEHQTLMSTSLGVILAFLSAISVYAILWASFYEAISGWFYLAVFLIIVWLVPFVIFLPSIIWLRAPSLSIKSYKIYIFATFVVEIFLVSVDPFHVALFTPMTLQPVIILFLSVQFLPLLALSAVIIVLARYFGYGVVLQGSTLSFKVKVISDVLKDKLEQLHQDFNFYFDGYDKETESFRYRKEKRKLQIFLRMANEKETHLVLVFHSTENDLPTNVDSNETRRLGNAIIGWLGAQINIQFTEFQDTPFLKQVIKDSKKAFLRKALGIPSKKEIIPWFKGHWKDIALTLTTIAALVGIIKAIG